MRTTIVLILALLLSGCAHHLVGNRMKPFHMIDDSGHEVFKGSWVAIDYDYKINGNTIDFDGTLSFDKNKDFQDWFHVKVKITFIFTDSDNIVRNVETKYVSAGGGYLGEEPFSCSFPYDEKYKSMRVDVNLTGYH